MELTLFPEREWFKRNLDMLRQSEHPDDYLAGVARVRGEADARRLREALQKNPPIAHSPFARLDVGQSVLLTGHPSAIRTAARRFADRQGWRIRSERLDDVIMFVRTA